MMQEQSLRQKYQQLTRAKANAVRAGQTTLKLDAKLDRVKLLMKSTVTKAPEAIPTESKYRNYKGVNKRPMQGGSVTPK